MYNLLRNRVNRERKKLAKVYYLNKLDDLKSVNPRNWWSIIKDITGQKKKRNDLQCVADLLSDGDMSKLTELLNDAFASVSAPLTPIAPSDNFAPPTGHLEDKYIVPIDAVKKQLAGVKCSKASGPDDIPNWLLKDNAGTLGAPVACIINSSLREGYVPPLWKSADVCPLPKVSQPTNIHKDFRPISLTPVLSKIAEKFVRDTMLDVINDSLDPRQFGSLKGTSTVMALVEMYHQWVTALDKPGRIVRILLLDFRKAFDLVDHAILLQKLVHTGAPDFLVNWTASFLCQRQQRVKIAKDVSPWSVLNAGVPQGTLLGPVCFLLHINDLKTSCDTYKYVDDSTAWEVCSGKHIGDSKIQNAADDAIKWSNDNNMKLNSDKTKEILVDFRRKKQHVPEITMGEVTIERVKSAKLLGVHISNDLKWDEHVNYICQKGSKRLYFVRVLKRSGVSANDLVKIFCVTIRSVLEYACELWHPGLTQCQSAKIESLQKRAMKIIFPSESYDIALNLANVPLLETRREEACRTFFGHITKPEHKLHHLLPTPRSSQHHLRTISKFPLPKIRTERVRQSVINYGLLKFQ